MAVEPGSRRRWRGSSAGRAGGSLLLWNREVVGFAYTMEMMNGGHGGPRTALFYASGTVGPDFKARTSRKDIRVNITVFKL